MANETKPQSGNTGTGAKVGDAGRQERGQDSGSAGERAGARENDTSGDPKRGPNETRPPGRRR